MIPTFLHSVAAQVRTLVREGRALHVSDKTADELELVAGLFKEPVRYQLPSPLAGKGGAVPDVYLEAEVTPADIAWAWLKLSACDLTKEPGKLTHWWEAELWPKMRRAAECAELAMIAGRMGVPEGRSIEIDGQEVRLCSPVNPHEGTRDGARAAWGHILAVLEATKDGHEVRYRYRRELEAL